MLLLSAALIATLGIHPASPVTDPDQATVSLRLNGGDYRPGDRVQVEVESAEDGYLLVLRVDGDGYVRALFPLDPDLDQFVRGDRRYQIRGRGERESFLADDRGGTGLVMAFLAREPFATEGFAEGTHWDYQRLRVEDLSGDIEAQVLSLVRTMTRGARFDYDVVGYRVWGPGYESTQPVIVSDPYYGDPYWGPSYACLACGWGHPRAGVSITIGNGWYDPWDPWYDPWYDRWDWRYRRSGWNGWWGWDPYWGTPWRPITVINTPPRPVAPNPIYGTRARARQPVADGVPGSAVPRLTEPVVGGGRVTPTRPSPVTDGRSRGRTAVTQTSEQPGRGVGRVETPPARPTAPPSRATTTTPGEDRSRSRRGGNEERNITPPSTETRRTEERPVYRPPVAEPRKERRPESSARPASSPPPERSSAPRTVERSSPPPAPRPVERSSPPPAPRSVERSSPPSSPPAQSSGRSRTRGD